MGFPSSDQKNGDGKTAATGEFAVVTINGNNKELDEEYQKPVINFEPKSMKPSCCTIFGYPPSMIKWSNVLWLLATHVIGVYGYYYAIVNGMKFYTVIWSCSVAAGSGFGILAGSHRLWAHRSYKARWPLRLLLVCLQTISVNGSVFSYARDHQVHHKYTDSRADPKNATRGFFFAHVGWWMVKKDPAVIQEGSKLNYEDMWNDPFVRIQHQFYVPMVLLFWFLIPAYVPLLWGEDLLKSILICVFFRYIVTLHHMFTVNSLAHLRGSRPYDSTMGPAENRWVNYLSMGEGSHNYHHIFPHDYRTCDRKWYYRYNPTTLFIDCSYYLGFAYDRKTTATPMVEQRITRTGKPEKFKDRPEWKLVFYGLCDWAFGLFTVMWMLWLALSLRVAYLAQYGELTLCNVLNY